jgi:mannose-6-phosphate isomerase-like protein (cupin superfamily)
MVVSDGPPPVEGTWTSEKANGADLWFLPQVPVDLSDQRDPISGYVAMDFPPPGGVIVRILTWQPGFSYPMHQSATIDFLFVITGRLELILDNGTSTLGPGDCVVQRGTTHAWRVLGDVPCTFAGIAVGAKA